MESSLLHQVIALRRPWLDEAMLFASAIGAGSFVWSVTALIAAVYPHKRAAAWRLILAVAVTFAICDYGLKPLFNRARPYEVDSSITVIDAKSATRSFPSGHAAMAVAGAIAGSQLIRYSGWIWWPLACIIAVSRIYIGVHWPSDVLAGALVGLATAWFVLGRTVQPSNRPIEDTI